MKVIVTGQDSAKDVADLVAVLKVHLDKHPNAKIGIRTHEYPDSRYVGRYTLQISWEEDR